MRIQTGFNSSAKPEKKSSALAAPAAPHKRIGNADPWKTKHPDWRGASVLDSGRGPGPGSTHRQNQKEMCSASAVPAAPQKRLGNVDPGKTNNRIRTRASVPDGNPGRVQPTGKATNKQSSAPAVPTAPHRRIGNGILGKRNTRIGTGHPFWIPEGDPGRVQPTGKTRKKCAPHLRFQPHRESGLATRILGKQTTASAQGHPFWMRIQAG